jgi:hypothetical protein
VSRLTQRLIMEGLPVKYEALEELDDRTASDRVFFGDL